MGQVALRGDYELISLRTLQERMSRGHAERYNWQEDERQCRVRVSNDLPAKLQLKSGRFVRITNANHSGYYHFKCSSFLTTSMLAMSGSQLSQLGIGSPGIYNIKISGAGPIGPFLYMWFHTDDALKWSFRLGSVLLPILMTALGLVAF